MLTCLSCGRNASCACAFVPGSIRPDRTGICRICADGRANTPLDIQLELMQPNEDLIELGPPVLFPKLLHWVWLGPAPIPAQDLAWVSSWIRDYPDWKPIIWTDCPACVAPSLGRPESAGTGSGIQYVSGVSGWAPKTQLQKLLDQIDVRVIPPLYNQRWFNQIERWVTGRAVVAARSDIVRMEIVLRYGGIYLDTDVESFKCAEDAFRGVRLFYSDEWGPSVGNYMFGGVPNHPALYSLVRELGPTLEGHRFPKDHPRAGQDMPANAVELTGPHYLATRLRAHPDCVIFPHMMFNPLRAWDDPEKVEKWPVVSYANHHYDGKWYDRAKETPPAEFLR